MGSRISDYVLKYDDIPRKLTGSIIFEIKGVGRDKRDAILKMVEAHTRDQLLQNMQLEQKKIETILPDSNETR